VSPRTKIVTELQEQRGKDSEYTPLASLVFCVVFFVRLFLHLLPFFLVRLFFLFYAPLAFFSLMTLPTRCTTQKETKGNQELFPFV